jgi:hypothetical protein
MAGPGYRSKAWKKKNASKGAGLLGVTLTDIVKGMKGSGGGRTASEAGLGRSMAAAGNKVSKSNRRRGTRSSARTDLRNRRKSSSSQSTDSAVETLAKATARNVPAVVPGLGSLPKLVVERVADAVTDEPKPRKKPAKPQGTPRERRMAKRQAKIDRLEARLEARPKPATQTGAGGASGPVRAPGPIGPLRPQPLSAAQRRRKNTQQQIAKQKKAQRRDRARGKDARIAAKLYKPPDYEGPRTPEEYEDWYDNRVNRILGDSRMGRLLRQQGTLPAYKPPKRQQGGRSSQEVKQALNVAGKSQSVLGATIKIRPNDFTAARGAWKNQEPTPKFLKQAIAKLEPPQAPASKKKIMSSPRAKRELAIAYSRATYEEAREKGLPVARRKENPWLISDRNAPKNETERQRFQRESRVLAQIRRDTKGDAFAELDAEQRQLERDAVSLNPLQAAMGHDGSAFSRIARDIENRARWVMFDNDTLGAEAMKAMGSVPGVPAAVVAGLQRAAESGDPRIDRADNVAEMFSRVFTTAARQEDGKAIANQGSFGDYLKAGGTLWVANIGRKLALGGMGWGLKTVAGTKNSDLATSAVRQFYGTKTGSRAAWVLNKLPTERWRQIRRGAGWGMVGAAGVDMGLSAINDLFEAAGKQGPIPDLPWASPPQPEYANLPGAPPVLPQDDDESYKSYVAPFIAANFKANVADSLGTSARNLITGLVFPFTFAANLAATGGRGIDAISDLVDGTPDPYYGTADYVFKPLTAMVKETWTEIERMSKALTSREIATIREVTEDDLGYLPMMSAFWLTRLTVGDSVSHAARKIAHSPVGKRAALELAQNRLTGPAVAQGKAVKRGIDKYKQRGRAVMIAGRAQAEGDWLTSTMRRATAKPTQVFRSIPGIKKHLKKLDDVSNAYARAHYEDMESQGAPDKVEVEDLATLFATIGFDPETGDIAELRERRDNVARGGTEHRLLVHAIRAHTLWRPGTIRGDRFNNIYKGAVDAGDVVDDIRNAWAEENGRLGERQMLRDRLVQANEKIRVAKSMGAPVEGPKTAEQATAEKFADAPKRQTEAEKQIEIIDEAVTKLTTEKDDASAAVRVTVEEQKDAVDRELHDREAIDAKTREQAAKTAGRRRSRGQRGKKAPARRTWRRRSTRKNQREYVTTEGTYRVGRHDATPRSKTSDTTINEVDFWHGSGTAGLTPEQLDWTKTDPLGFVGPGFYIARVGGGARWFAWDRSSQERYNAEVKEGGNPDARSQLYRARLNLKRVLESHSVREVELDVIDSLQQASDELGGYVDDVYGFPANRKLPFKGDMEIYLERAREEFGVLTNKQILEDWVHGPVTELASRDHADLYMTAFRNALVERGYDAISFKITLPADGAAVPSPWTDPNAPSPRVSTQVINVLNPGPETISFLGGPPPGNVPGGPLYADYSNVPEYQRVAEGDIMSINDVQARIAVLDAMIKRGDGDQETLKEMRAEARALRAKLKRVKRRINKVHKSLDEKRAKEQARLDAISKNLREEKVARAREVRVREEARRQQGYRLTEEERADLYEQLSPTARRAMTAIESIDESLATLNDEQDMLQVQHNTNEVAADIIEGGPKALEDAQERLYQAQERLALLQDDYENLPDDESKEAVARLLDEKAQDVEIVERGMALAQAVLTEGRGKRQVLKQLEAERDRLNGQQSIIEDAVSALALRRLREMEVSDIDTLVSATERQMAAKFYEEEKDQALEDIVLAAEERAEEAARIVALADPVYIRHTAETRGPTVLNPMEDDSDLGLESDQRRTGELGDAGQVDRGYDAFNASQQREVDRHTTRRIISAIVKEGLIAIRWDDGSLRTVFAPEEIPRAKVLYREQYDSELGDDGLQMNRNWPDDPDQMIRVLTPSGEFRQRLKEGRLRDGRKDQVKEELANAQEEIDAMEKDVEWKRATGEPHVIHDPAFDARRSPVAREAYGEEEGVVFVKATYMTTFRKLNVDVEGAHKFFFWFNRVSSRMVLGSSLAWMFAQPIAEMAIALAQHPASIWGRFAEVRDIRAEGGTGARVLAGKASTTPGADPASGYRTRPGIREEQRRIKETMTTIKGSPGYGMVDSLAEAEPKKESKFLRKAGEAPQTAANRSALKQFGADLVTLRLPGTFDRWKAGWIREAAFLANLDHHLKPLTRAAKSVRGQIDLIEKYADMLSKMTREEQLKWLDSDEGMEVGLELAKQIDDQLGNWQDLRPGVEAAIGQVIFFYPFIRFSLNWALRTYPKEHPVIWTLAMTLGAANSEVLERMVNYDPLWPTDWAVAPVFAGPNGEITSLVAVNRYNSASNAATEMALSDSNSPFWNLTKLMLPPFNIAAQMAAGVDEYGNKFGDSTDAFGEEDPSVIARIGQGLDQIATMLAPYRLGTTATGFNMRNLFERLFGNAKTEVDVFEFVDPLGRDPNERRAFARGFAVPSLPMPISMVTDDDKYRKMQQEVRNIKATPDEYLYFPKRADKTWKDAVGAIAGYGYTEFRRQSEERGVPTVFDMSSPVMKEWGHLYREPLGQENVKLRINGKWREVSFRKAGEYLTGEVRIYRSENKGKGMTPRNPYEQDIAKQYLAIKSRNAGNDEQLQELYGDMRKFRYKRGLPVDPDSAEGRDKQRVQDEYLDLYRDWQQKFPNRPMPESRSVAERLLKDDVSPGLGKRRQPAMTEYRDVGSQLGESQSDMALVAAGTRRRLAKMGMRRLDADRFSLSGRYPGIDESQISPAERQALLDPETKVEVAGKAGQEKMVVKKWRGVRLVGELRNTSPSRLAAMEQSGALQPDAINQQGYRYHRELDALMSAGDFDKHQSAEAAADRLSKLNNKLARTQAKAGGVPSGVPAEYRKAIKKWGAWLDKRPDMKSPNDDMVDGLIPKSMTGAEYLAKIIQHESTWNADAYNDRAGATGMGQFIPSTRQGMIDQYGVDPWASGNDAIHAAALYLSEGGGGLVNYNSVYPTSGDNQGTYGTWDGYLGEDVGQMVQVDKKAQARLKQLRQERKDVEALVEKQNKQLKEAGLPPITVDDARVGYDIGGEAKPLPGKFSGSRRAVSMLLGQPVWGDHMPFPGGTGGPDETDESHSTDGFHDLPYAYAQDIGTSGGRPEEGEAGLGYNQETMDKIARNLQKMGSSVDSLTLGQDYREVLPNGYEVEIYTSAASGHDDHLHVAMKWVGGGQATGGSVSGGGAGSAGGSSSSGGGFSAGGAPAIGSGSGNPLGFGQGTGASWRDLPLQGLSGGGQDYDEGGVDSAVTTMAETSDPTSGGAAVKSGIEQMAALPQVRKKKKVPRFSNNPI